MTSGSWHSSGELQDASFPAATSHSHQLHPCITLPLRDGAANKWGRKIVTLVFTNCHLYKTGGIFLLRLKALMSSFLLIKSSAFDSLKSSKEWPVMVSEKNGKIPKLPKRPKPLWELPTLAGAKLLKFCGLHSGRQVGIWGVWKSLWLPTPYFFPANKTPTLFKYQVEILWPQDIIPCSPIWHKGICWGVFSVLMKKRQLKRNCLLLYWLLPPACKRGIRM